MDTVRESVNFDNLCNPGIVHNIKNTDEVLDINTDGGMIG